MRVQIFFLTLLSALSMGTAFSSVWAVEPGMYACLIDRMAGIAPQKNTKPSDKWNKRTSGTFQPEQSHYILKIARHDELVFPKIECESPSNQYTRESAIAVLRCSGHVKLNAKIGEQYFFSLDGNNFLAAGPHDIFHTLFVGEGLSFVRTMIHRLGGNFVQEGYCEKFDG